jgi:hypothetical protein
VHSAAGVVGAWSCACAHHEQGWTLFIAHSIDSHYLLGDSIGVWDPENTPIKHYWTHIITLHRSILALQGAGDIIRYLEGTPTKVRLVPSIYQVLCITTFLYLGNVMTLERIWIGICDCF